jgi:replicative DNA helicase
MMPRANVTNGRPRARTANRPKVGGEILDKMPPCDLDAERWVLGSILHRPAALDEVADLLEAPHFYAVAHQLVYEHLQEWH